MGSLPKVSNDKQTATYWFELLESVSPSKLNDILKNLILNFPV